MVSIRIVYLRWFYSTLLPQLRVEECVYNSHATLRAVHAAHWALHAHADSRATRTTRPHYTTTPVARTLLCPYSSTGLLDGCGVFASASLTDPPCGCPSQQTMAQNWANKVNITFINIIYSRLFLHFIFNKYSPCFWKDSFSWKILRRASFAPGFDTNTGGPTYKSRGTTYNSRGATYKSRGTICNFDWL